MDDPLPPRQLAARALRTIRRSLGSRPIPPDLRGPLDVLAGAVESRDEPRFRSVVDVLADTVVQEYLPRGWADGPEELTREELGES